MSGKLLYTLSDENPELHKQIGCLTGMFQLFDGHCFLNSPNIAGNTLKRIPEGRSQRSNIRSKPPSSESQRRAEKLRIKGVRDKQQVSSDSSRTSITFSPCSSSFSSAESSKISQQELPVFQPNGSFQQKWKGCDLRDVVRDSIDSSSSEIRQNYGFRDLQREKGNSNFLTCPQESESSRRTSTVVTKLMGLEVPAQSVVSNQNEARQIQSSPSEAIRSFSISRKAENHNENYICNSRRTTSDSYKKPIETSRFLMQPKQLDGSKVNRFFSKTKTEPRNSSVSVDGEIRKGLAELQLKKSIKDLRALEQILETLEKTQKELEIRTKKSDCTNRFQRSNSLKKLESSIVIMEPIKGNGEVSKSTSESMRNPSSVTHTIPTSNTEDNKTDRKLDKSLRKVNQRVQQKKLESDSPSRRSRQKLQNQQQADISTKISRDQKNKNHRSDVSSPMLTETNIKLDSEQHKAKQSTGLGFNEARLLTDPGKLPLEQPSPISVLDATFYRDYSLSPVKKISNLFKDDDPLSSEEADWMYDDEINNFNAGNIVYSSSEEVVSDESSTIHNFRNQDHRYIHDILFFASGFIRDKESNLTSMLFHQSCPPINPNLFLAFEQSKIGGEILKGIKRGNKQISQAERGEKVRRKLIFDAVNETLTSKVGYNGFTHQCFSQHKRPSGNVTLETLCSEIDALLASHSNFSLKNEDDSLKSLILKDLMLQEKGWSELQAENPGIVLDVERLIFKDLINEVVNGEIAAAKASPGRRHRQFLFN